MGNPSIGFLASLIYCGAAILQYFNLSNKLSFSKSKLIGLSLIALSLHGYLLYRWIDTPLGQNLSASHLFSLIAWFIALSFLTSSLLRPLENLLLFILPIAALSIPLSFLFPGASFFQTRLHPGHLIHILISILAFGVIGMAVLQATLLYLQNRLLRNKSRDGVLWVLPPLQTMETLLFQILWFGFLLLSASLCSAFLFLDEQLFTATRTQKIIFSLLAWGLFALLLYGHHQSGLRGLKAIRWILIGAALLILAYLGGKSLNFGSW